MWEFPCGYVDDGEDQRGRVVPNVAGEMPFEVGNDRGPDADDPATGARFGRSEQELTVGPLDVRLTYPDGSVFRSRSERVSAVASPQRRLAKVAGSTRARYLRSWVQSVLPSSAIFHSARSASWRLASRRIAVRITSSRRNRRR